MGPGPPEEGTEQKDGNKCGLFTPFADPGDGNSKLFPFVRIVGGERGSEERVKDI